MVTISICMIVKNEERVLARCLDSIKDIADEIVIVDTGSSDSTKEIAAKYTDKIYDFAWVDDFSKARNFAMNKCNMDYIYMPDADEVMDEVNLGRFKVLKENLLTEIEIVEMWYVNQLSNGTVYNFDRELRPKLYKRLREFVFIDPVHEMVRLDPVVFESDIEIIHMPEGLHASRDLDIFNKYIKKNGSLSKRLVEMYARELMVSGKEEDFLNARSFFLDIAENETNPELIKLANIVLAEAAVVRNDTEELLKYSIKDIADNGSSEICTILGAFYENKQDLKEAILWYYNARYEVEAQVNIRYQQDIPLKGLIRVSKALGDIEAASKYEAELESL